MKLLELSLPQHAQTDLGLKHYARSRPAFRNIESKFMEGDGRGFEGAGRTGAAAGRCTSLNRAQVTDAGLKELAGMTQLQELSIVGVSKVTDAGLKELARTAATALAGHQRVPG